MKKQIALVLAAAAAAAIPSAAHAGGFDFPDNGTEALGRGGAFTAKADDGTAIEYNIAGLAQQRGWRLLFDSNLVFNTYTFQRAGNYPDALGMESNMTGQPYGGAAFPKVQNNGGVFYAPFIGLSTDFDRLDRWTFAIGLFGPSSVGRRDYGETANVVATNGMSVLAPAPQRYDVTAVNLLLAFPTLAASFRATHWFDVGVALQLVYGSFDVGNASLVYLGSVKCQNFEDTVCDSVTRITASTVTATASLGLMFHPVRGLHIGANLRPEVAVDATGGHANATPPREFPAGFAIPPAGDVEFHTKLPWEARLGVRYAFMAADDFEMGDVELDGTYEAWHHAEGDGDKIYIPQLGPLVEIRPDITHHFQDTYSARVGGAYNLRVNHQMTMSFRIGGYFDSAATKYKDTRMDFDTMAKWAGTAGIGVTVRGITLNVAYAYVWSPDRTVTNGDIRVINGVLMGQQQTEFGPTPVINNGHYHASNQILSLGLTVAFADLIGYGKKRVVRFK